MFKVTESQFQGTEIEFSTYYPIKLNITNTSVEGESDFGATDPIIKEIIAYKNPQFFFLHTDAIFVYAVM